MTEVSKLVGYATLGPSADSAMVSKLVPYAVAGPEAGEVYVPKLVAYVVTGPPDVIGILHILTWTFTLDDHDFLVIQLQESTLVYDFLVAKWYVWGSGLADAVWQAARGQNWNANLGALMPDLGGYAQSNVVCGDGETGALYFLDPELAEDYSSLGVPAQPFRRVITGQIAMRGNDYVSCPSVEVTSSAGEAESGLVDSSVLLTISDDKGHSFWSAGSRTPGVSEYDFVLSWGSLGSFTGPGRLFRITDYGALSRVDGLDMPDGS